MQTPSSRAPFKKQAHYWISGTPLQFERSLERLIPSRRIPTRPSWKILKRISPFPSPFPKAQKTPRLRKLPDRSLVLNWPGRGIFWIRPAERQVQYDLMAVRFPDLFWDVFLGPVVSYLLMLEGRHPLHATAISLQNRAVCFMGYPGAGKSSLAAALVLSGCKLLADDLLTIQNKNGRLYACPAYPEIRLWPGSGQRLIENFDKLPRVIPTASKRRLDTRLTRGGFEKRAVVLGLIYEIQHRGKIQKPEVQELGKKEAVMMFHQNLYNTALQDPPRMEERFDQLSEIARKTTVRRLLLPRRIAHPFLVSDFVLDDIRQNGF